METALLGFAIGFCGASAVGIFVLVVAWLGIAVFDFLGRRNHGHD